MRYKLILILFFPIWLYSQCGPSTPTFTVNLTGSPNGSWLSPNVVRNDVCCGQNGVTCIKFIVTLDPNATGINFNIFSGAVPSGALYYQVNCGPQTALGTPICLSGVGPHIITFCKPGNNANVYQITSIPPSTAGTNITINDGCVGNIVASGFNPSTVTWNSVFPGAPGAYNNYLSCTSGCLNPSVTATGTLPAYVDYVICGQPSSLCNFSTICDTVRVTFNPTLLVNIIPMNPTICFGQTFTTISAIGSGGTPPYSYLWNNVNTSQTINVGVGTFNIKLTDASGCPPVYNSVTVKSFSVPISANAGPDKTLCKQSPVATINASVTGASGGVWSGGGGVFNPNNITLTNLTYSPTIAELTTGSVTLFLTTTGNGSCPSDQDTVIINYFGFMGIISPSVTNVSCYGGNNGSATINLSGGPNPYTYLWSASPTSTNSTVSSLIIGTYSVTIKDGIGCVSQTTVNITQPTPLAVNATVTNVSCFTGSNGIVSITPVGGTAPYSYLWSTGGQTTSSVTGLVAGIYSVTITDAKGCLLTSTYTITQPPALVIAFTQTNVSCFGGNNGLLNSTITGGTTPYTYSWSPVGATTQNISGLTAGTYSLTVKDNLNCSVINTVTITQPTVLMAATSVTNETCDYLNNGLATAIPSGGTPGYTYTWQPGSQSSASATGLSSGNYTLTVMDSKGCLITTFATINEPAPLVINFINQINVSCFGGNDGSVGSNPTGGTPNYSYSWTPSGSNNASISNLTIGTYTLRVTDGKSCTAINSLTITQPAVLTVANTLTNVSCFGGSNGSVSLIPLGGTAPYSYLWSTGGQTTSSVTGLVAGIYSVTITDAKGCLLTSTYTITQPPALVIAFTQTNVSCFGGNNGLLNSTITGGTTPYTYSWSPVGATTQNISGLTAGTYSLTVKDNLNCSVINTVTITQPTVLMAATSVTNETCDYLNNGLATAIPSGGTPGYTYTWQPGSQSSASATGLSSGNYTLTVMDSKGCLITTFATINEPAPLVINFINQINVSCFGGNDGSVGSNPTGGTPNYSYSWTPSGSNNASISNLTIGTYTLRVTDGKSCTAINSLPITQPAVLAVVVSSSSATCNAGNNGSASSSASGGTSPYTYNWIPGNLVGPTILNLSAGIYTVISTDNQGCVSSNTIAVTEPLPVLPVTSSTNSTCGSANGKAEVSVTGGIAPYTFLWPSGGTNALEVNLLAAAYTVTVTDNNGCSASQYVNINDSGGPVASIFSTTNVSCFGGTDGSATAGVVGGLAPITYSWTPFGGSGPTANGLTAGTFYVTVNDANGCKSLATTSPIITQPPAITANITVSNVSCFGGSNGTASVTAGGGTPGYSYSWLPGASTGTTVSGLSLGTHSVQVTDSKSCVYTVTYAVSQPTAALLISTSSLSVSCFGGNNGSASSIVNGGTAPYNYNWMPGSFSSQNISNLTAGIYSITATDSKGCISSNTITVIEPASITLVTNSSNSNCSLANGQASVTASGGTGAYSYSWSPSGGIGSSASGLLTGSYSVTVKDINNCKATATQFVNDNPKPLVTVPNSTNVSCYNGSDAVVTASVSGGTGPFTYTWSAIGGNNQSASGLPIGIYTITVTSANGCTVIATSPLVTQPSQIFTTIYTSNVSCFGGSDGTASVTAGGGTPGYSYSWLPEASTGTTVSGLSIGTHSVQVTDSKNCVYTATYAISQPTAALTVSASSLPVSCFGGNNGSATSLVSGGTAPYNYTWTPFGGNGPNAIGLSQGSYTLNIIDSKGCAATTTIFVNQPSQPLSATGNGVATSCSGGSNGTASVSPSGGTPGYTYQWSPASAGTGQSASSLSPGTYNITIKDAKNCQTSVSIIVSQPTTVTCSLIPINASCGLANGSITSQVSGGTGPYAYLWSPVSSSNPNINGLLPGTYSLQVTDNANCTSVYSTALSNIPGPSLILASTGSVSCFGGNNGTATININQGTAPYSITWLPYGGNSVITSSLVAGTYTANVTDALGCKNSISATINEPTPLSISINSVTNASCYNGNNGSVSVSGTGGIPAYSYTWSTMGTGPTINNLNAGVYNATVKDANNCFHSISIIVSEPPILTSTITNVVNAVCSYGMGDASVFVSGGTVPYFYSWSSIPIQTGSTAQNISPGLYSVTITDANGCMVSNSVTINAPLPIITTASINDTICLGQSGAVYASATGGSGNYYYTWQPSGAINTGTYNITPSSNTTYTVIAYDQNGCAGTQDTTTAIVYSLTSGNIQANGYSPICPGQSSTIYAQTYGNTGPLFYSWNNGLGTGPGAFLVTPTNPITYIVTVSNSCGTSVTDSVRILFNPPPTVIMSINALSGCALFSTNFTDSSITGNSADPITGWAWSFGDGSSSSSQNPSHTYTASGSFSVSLTVTTNQGCTNNNLNSPITVTVYPTPKSIFTVNSTQLNIPFDVLYCANQSIGATNYIWSFGDNETTTVKNPSHLYTNLGTFNVQLIAINQFGCKDTSNVLVNTFTDITIPTGFTPSENGSSGGIYNSYSLDNDVFFPYTSGVNKYHLSIFNRWGELIFETFDFKQGWDGYYRGTVCPQGVYVWKIDLEWENGKKINKVGDVTLLK